MTNNDKDKQTTKESKVSTHPDPVNPKQEQETKKEPPTQHPDPDTTKKKTH